jgi:hypothetical protein
MSDGAQYPWEKPKDEGDAPPEEQGYYPWLGGEADPDGSEDDLPVLSGTEEVIVRQMVAEAGRKPWLLATSLPSFAYSDSNPEQPEWLPVAALAGGATLFGALLVFLLNQPAEPPPGPVATRQPVPEQVRPSAETSAPPPADGTLIPPTDPQAILEREKKSAGRDNPFRDTLPVEPPPPTSAAAPVPVVKPVPPPPPPPPVLSVVSVAVSTSQQVALVQVTDQGRSTVYEVASGDQVAGWQVKSVTAERVLLSKGRQIKTLLVQ